VTLIQDAVRHPDVVGSVKSQSEIDEWNEIARARGDEGEIITKDNQKLERRARRAIQEYTLNNDGISYANQGYALPNGEIAATKMVEHLIITDTVASERRRKINGS
jgi:hypothetical protein